MTCLGRVAWKKENTIIPKTPTHMSAWVKFAKLYLTTMDRQDKSGDV